MSQAASYRWTWLSLDGRVVSTSGAGVFEQEPHALVGATLASRVAADDAAAVTDMLTRPTAAARRRGRAHRHPPEVAQALVGLGTDLAGIVTRNTLDAGIRYASERG